MPRFKKTDKNSVKVNANIYFKGKKFEKKKVRYTVRTGIDSERLNIIACVLFAFFKTDNALIRKLKNRNKKTKQYTSLTKLAHLFYKKYKNLLYGTGIELIANLDSFFSQNLRISAFHNAIGKNIVYKSKQLKNDKLKPVYLLKRKNCLHNYDLLISPAKYFKVKYFCNECLKQCRKSTINMKICCKICLKCRHTNCLIDNQKIVKRCEDCNRYFYGEQCFSNHKANGTCDNIHRCIECKLEVTQKTNFFHDCLPDYCSFCEINHPPGCCYITPKKKKKIFSKQSRVFYFDVETLQNKKSGELKPYICICGWYNNYDKISTKLFEGYTCVSDFVMWLLSAVVQFSSSEIIVLAHNFKGFDGVFVQHELCKISNIKLDVIYDGTKINLIAVKNGIRTMVKFIDSYNFLNVSLRDLPKIFGITQQKTFFPYSLLNEIDIYYTGSFPEKDKYDIFLLKPNEVEDFNNFYDKEKHKYQNKMWCCIDVLKEYCKNDVIVLVKCLEKFRDLHIDITQIDPYNDITLAGSALTDFIQNHIDPCTIGVIPKKGYSKCGNQSNAAFLWLQFREYQLKSYIQHEQQGGEYKFKRRHYKLDGVCHEKKICLEFMGCYYHGCNVCFENIDYNFNGKNHMASLYYQSIDRIEEIKMLIDIELPGYT